MKLSKPSLVSSHRKQREAKWLAGKGGSNEGQQNFIFPPVIRSLYTGCV